ncbi:MAG: UDP-N-acetylmuramate--L-alanine ligase [marine bacterium B5-7]|nr:MAG: UDP-N-acetylmuramate--L-alanine ligase [marine bacterium B5-7]
MRKIKQVHFIGIGGVGMSAIAEVLHREGYTITGTDAQGNGNTKRLQALGLTIEIGHTSQLGLASDVVVISTAIQPDNPEYVAMQAAEIPIMRRAEMLAELMRLRKGIAIAGTHGKTTTTGLTAALLSAGGLSPTYVIGGILNSAGSNAKLGNGEYLVAEADESDASFLHLVPTIAAVTNIEPEHMSTYDGDFSRLKQTFLDFLLRLPLDGLAVLCHDDEHIRSLLPQIARPLVTYGFDEAADVRAVNFVQLGTMSHFDVRAQDRTPFAVQLNLPGKHNVSNALAAIAIALHAGVSETVIQHALQSFEGVGRRFQQVETCIDNMPVTLIDDYGHHPTEVRVTLETIRAVWPDRRLLLVFQPHRFTRTEDCFDDFVEVLSRVDGLVLLDVHPAGEAHNPHADSHALARAIRQRGTVEPIVVSNTDELPSVLSRQLKTDDVLLMQGAGSIARLVQQFIVHNEKRPTTN